MSCLGIISFIFFFKQKTAYEMRISDWSSDVCSSDLTEPAFDLGNVLLANVERQRHVARAEFAAAEQAQQLHVEQRGLVLRLEIGRASCRERVCQYVYISVVAV